MFWMIPDEFMASIKGVAKRKTLKDVSVGSIWKDVNNDTLWRVTFKDNKVHVLSVADSELLIYGVNMFFATFYLVEYGAICVSCKKKYEYAERQIGFRCWSCKNGA